jgi:hypothetical protein
MFDQDCCRAEHRTEGDKEQQRKEGHRTLPQSNLSRRGVAIALDSGTTTFELARLLGAFKNLTVVTMIFRSHHGSNRIPK